MDLKLVLALLLLTCGFSAPAHAQGCAACKDAVAGSPQQTQRAFRRGIMMLLVPAAGAILAFGVIIVKNRRAPE